MKVIFQLKKTYPKSECEFWIKQSRNHGPENLLLWHRKENNNIKSLIQVIAASSFSAHAYYLFVLPKTSNVLYFLIFSCSKIFFLYNIHTQMVRFLNY